MTDKEDLKELLDRIHRELSELRGIVVEMRSERLGGYRSPEDPRPQYGVPEPPDNPSMTDESYDHIRPLTKGGTR